MDSPEYLESLPSGQHAPEQLRWEDRGILRFNVQAAIDRFGKIDREEDRIEASFMLEPHEFDFDGPKSVDGEESMAETEVVCCVSPADEPENYELRITRRYYHDGDDGPDDMLELTDCYVVNATLDDDLYYQERSSLYEDDSDRPPELLQREELSDEQLERLIAEEKMTEEQVADMEPGRLNQYLDGATGELPLNTDILEHILPVFNLLDEDHFLPVEDDE